MCNNLDVFKGLTTGVVVVSPDEHIVFVNKAAEKLLMKDRSLILGTCCHNTLRMSHCGSNCLLKKTLELGTSQYIGINCQYITPGDQVRDFHVSSAPIKEDNGSISAIALFINSVDQP